MWTFSIRNNRRAITCSARPILTRLAVERLEDRIVPYAAGTLDSTFGVGGMVTTHLAPWPTVQDSAVAVTLPSTNQVLVLVNPQRVAPDSSYAGPFAVARINSDGSLDPSFGTNGMQEISFSNADAMALQPDGKIVVLGDVSSGPTAVTRLTADGSLDTTFGTNGSQRIDTGYLTTQGSCVAIQSDGRIVLAAEVAEDYRGASNAIDVARLNYDGSLDTSFGTNGQQTVLFGYGGGPSARLAIQSDGGIILAGTGTDGSIGVARLDSCGNLDPSFGTAGEETLQHSPGSDFVTSAAIQSDGKIVLAMGSGDYYGDFAGAAELARLNSDGSLDAAFGAGGWRTVSFGPNSSGAGFNALAVQPDGELVAAGFSAQAPASAGTDFAVARLNADGSLDTSFGNDGTETIAFGDFGLQYESAAAMAVRSDGAIILVGQTPADTTEPVPALDLALARLTANGSLDSTFADQGRTTVHVPAFTYDTMGGMALQPDGKILVAGSAWNGDSAWISVSLIGVARYNPDGTLDPTFGDLVNPNASSLRSGIAILPHSSDIYAQARGQISNIALESDGKILVSWVYYAFNPGGADQFFVARLDSNGDLDSSFGVDGIAQTGIAQNSNSPGPVLGLQTDGKIVVIGPDMSRLNYDGSIDTSFGTNGHVPLGFPVGLGAVGLAVQADGGIVVLGGILGYSTADGTHDFLVTRFDCHGIVDTSFGDGGTRRIDFNSGDDHPAGVVIQPNGAIVVAGSSIQDNVGYFAAARLDTQGNLDPSFAETGKVIISFGTDDDELGNLALQPDGKIVLVGDSDQFPSAAGSFDGYDFAIARLNSDGSLDASFGSGGKVTTYFGDLQNSGANVAAVQPDGKVVVLGQLFFSSTFGMAVARYIGVTDTDNDGIADSVDTQPTVYSNDFSDGTTTGTITSRGDQVLTITNAPNPADGIEITAGFQGGSTPATVSIDNGTLTLTLHPGDQVIVKDGSIVIQVFAGTVGASFAGASGQAATVSIDAGNSVTFDPVSASLSAPATNTQTIEVFHNGTPTTITPGQTLLVFPASLSGIVFEDFNDDGQVDFGERGIPGVSIHLTGTDVLGNAVDLLQTTDADGAYVFLNLVPGSYYITETQPAGYLQGTDAVGTAGGSLADIDKFFVQLGAGVNGLNYNYGEQPPAGASVQRGQTASIGFWNNKNGQKLIKAFNGGTGHPLGDWLAATLPHIFGAQSAYNLAGHSNADVATLFQSDFVMKGVKLDAQVLATALSVYATNATLDSTGVAAPYGFTVSGDGVADATVSVGSNGDAFGVANNTTMTVLDLLLATDEQAVNGVLYGGNSTLRNHANNVYSAVNQAGGI